MNIKKISVLLSLLVTVLFSACEQDNMGPVYGEGGLTFSASSLGAITIAPTDPTFTVDLFRGDSAGELNGTLSINVYQTATQNGQTVQVPMSGATVTDYSFAAGENIATVTVDMSETGLAIGATATVEVSFDATLASVGGSNTVDANVTMDYTWVSLGTGTFADNYFFSDPVDVEIFEAAEVPGLYQIAEPWGGYIDNPSLWDPSVSAMIGTSEPGAYFQFQVQDDGSVVYNAYTTGLVDKEMGEDLVLYHPLLFGLPADNNRKLSETEISIAPMYYMETSGYAYNATTYLGVVLITLPTAE